MHMKLGSKIESGQALCTLFADEQARFDEAEHLLLGAISIHDTQTQPPPLIGEILTGNPSVEKIYLPAPVPRTVG